MKLQVLTEFGAWACGPASGAARTLLQVAPSAQPTPRRNTSLALVRASEIAHDLAARWRCYRWMEALKWPLERRRVVLLPELAHSKRRDCLTQRLAQVACALYWFKSKSQGFGHGQTGFACGRRHGGVFAMGKPCVRDSGGCRPRNLNRPGAAHTGKLV